MAKLCLLLLGFVASSIAAENQQRCASDDNKEVVLVTGGLGFIGSHVVEALLEKGYKVEVLDDASNGANFKKLSSTYEAKWTDGDISKVDTYSKIGKVDYIIHLAAAISVAESMNDPEKYNRTNVEGSRLLLDFAQKTGVKMVVAASSAAVYGDIPDKLPIDESNTYGGRDLSCLFSEMLQNWKLVETPNIDIAHSISLCVEIASRVQSLSLFSSNEDVEEITTSSLRYLMVKYFEAQFRLKPHERDPQMDSLREVMGCFLQFLKRLNDYGLKHNEAGGRQDPRTAKIERYKKEKRLKEQVSKFEKDYPEGSAEEELERKYWFDFIELAETNSSEHISMLKREVDMIKLRERGVRPEPPRQPPNGQHSQPIIVTRDAQMKQVFGLGYPSRPVYTVEEFGDVMVEKMKQEAIDKAKWEAENPKPASMDFRELTEEEEEKERRNAQRWDNHKDYTRRGDGNRKNMG